MGYPGPQQAKPHFMIVDPAAVDRVIATLQAGLADRLGALDRDAAHMQARLGVLESTLTTLATSFNGALRALNTRLDATERERESFGSELDQIVMTDIAGLADRLASVESSVGVTATTRRPAPADVGALPARDEDEILARVGTVEAVFARKIDLLAASLAETTAALTVATSAIAGNVTALRRQEERVRSESARVDELGKVLSTMELASGAGQGELADLASRVAELSGRVAEVDARVRDRAADASAAEAQSALLTRVEQLEARLRDSAADTRLSEAQGALLHRMEHLDVRFEELRTSTSATVTEVRATSVTQASVDAGHQRSEAVAASVEALRSELAASRSASATTEAVSRMASESVAGIATRLESHTQDIAAAKADILSLDTTTRATDTAVAALEASVGDVRAAAVTSGNVREAAEAALSGRIATLEAGFASVRAALGSTVAQLAARGAKAADGAATQSAELASRLDAVEKGLGAMGERVGAIAALAARAVAGAVRGTAPPVAESREPLVVENIGGVPVIEESVAATSVVTEGVAAVVDAPAAALERPILAESAAAPEVPPPAPDLALVVDGPVPPESGPPKRPRKHRRR